MELLITLLVLAVAVWLAFWIVEKSAPAEIQVPVKVVLGVLALIGLFEVLTGHLPLLVR